MYVVEEWLSSTEPGLQIDSPPFFSSVRASISRSSDTEKILLLRNYFNFDFQLAGLAGFCVPFTASVIAFSVPLIR